MNKREIIAKGFARGYSIAKSIDLIDIGDYCDGEVLQTGKREKITTDNWFEAHTNIAYECESQNRQFSPFEFLANDINNYEYKYNREGWICFDEAIGRGIAKALKERWKSISWSKAKYVRKTRDLWDVIGTYSLNQGFSHEVVSTWETRKEARDAIREYRENESHICFALKKYRERIG